MVLQLAKSNDPVFDSPNSLTSTICRDPLLKKEDSQSLHSSVNAPNGEGTLNRWPSLRSRLSIGNIADGNPPKRVRFSRAKPDVFHTLTRDDLSDKEYFSYWIQPDEMERSNYRCWDIIDAYEKAKLNGEVSCQFCTRGLESYIIERRKGKEIHRIKRENAYIAVLLWGRGLTVEERARRYHIVSRRCMVRAREFGRRDALAAKQIHDEKKYQVAERSAHRQLSVPVLSARDDVAVESYMRRNSASDVPARTKNATNEIADEVSKPKSSESSRAVNQGGMPRVVKTLKRSSSFGDLPEGNGEKMSGAPQYRPRVTRSKSPPQRRRPLERNSQLEPLNQSRSSGAVPGKRNMRKSSTGQRVNTNQSKNTRSGTTDSRSPRRISCLPVPRVTRSKSPPQRRRPLERNSQLEPLNQSRSSGAVPGKRNMRKSSTGRRMNTNQSKNTRSGTTDNRSPRRISSLSVPNTSCKGHFPSSSPRKHPVVRQSVSSIEPNGVSLPGAPRSCTPAAASLLQNPRKRMSAKPPQAPPFCRSSLFSRKRLHLERRQNSVATVNGPSSSTSRRFLSFRRSRRSSLQAQEY